MRPPECLACTDRIRFDEWMRCDGHCIECYIELKHGKHARVSGPIPSEDDDDFGDDNLEDVGEWDNAVRALEDHND